MKGGKKIEKEKTRMRKEEGKEEENIRAKARGRTKGDEVGEEKKRKMGEWGKIKKKWRIKGGGCEEKRRQKVEKGEREGKKK